MRATLHLLSYPTLGVALAWNQAPTWLAFWIATGAILGVFLMPIALVVNYWWLRGLDRWLVHRLRVMRRHRRAEYLRWWDEHR